MIGEFYFDLSSLTSILTLLLVIVAIIYFYFEIKKINDHISFLEECYNSLNVNPKNNDMTDKEIKLDSVVVDNINYDDELKNYTTDTTTNTNDTTTNTTTNTNDTTTNTTTNTNDTTTDTTTNKENTNNEWSEIDNLMNTEDTHELEKEDFQESKKELNEANKVIQDSLQNQDLLGSTTTEDINEDIDNILNSFDDNNDLSIKTIETTNYENMTVSELKKILTDNGLPVSGNKTKLISRIKEHRSIEM